MLDGLSPEERDQFEEWARHQRETNIKELAHSAMIVSIYPNDAAKLDVPYMLQTGAAVLLDKPILLLVAPGVEIPVKLRKVADKIIEAHPDEIDVMAPRVAEEIQAFIKEYVEE